MRLCLHRLIQCAMQEKDLKEILNATYELEGLLQLSLTGKQDLSRLHDLIVDKGHLISSLCDRLPAAATEPDEAAAAGYYVAEEVADDIPAVEPVEDEPAVVEEQPVEPLPAEPEPVPDFSHIEGVSFADTPGIPNSADEPEEPEGQAVAQEAAPAHQPLRLVGNPGGRPKLRRLFPINEVFLFRRELFGGSDVDFNASLAIVEDLGSYAAAEDYFVSDLQWNLNDPTVAQFLAIIKKYFKQQ